MTAYTLGKVQLKFPQELGSWQNIDGTEFDDINLVSGDTLHFEGNDVTYTYDASLDTWTDK